LSERREPEADADALEGGTILHAALEAVLATGMLPTDAAERAAHVSRTLEREHRRILDSVPPKERMATEVRWRRVVQAVAEIAEIEALRWETLGGAPRESFVEWAFDPAAGDEGGLSLRGRADLVDVVQSTDAPTRIVVTDYKSGRDRSVFTKRLSERGLGVTAFQLPVYLEAARRAFAGADPQVVLEGRFVAAFAPRSEKVASVTMTPAAVADVMEKVERLRRSAVDGHFDVDPLACDEWCRFRAVCRYVRPPTEESDA